MPVSIKLDGIFDKAKRDRAASNAVSRATRRFARYVPEQQEKSKPTGKVRTVGQGRGFIRRHRSSAKGQRPAKMTGHLSKSTKHKMTGKFEGEVTTVAKRDGFDYAQRLQNKLDRPIQNAPEDDRAAQRMLNEEAERAMSKL